MKKILNIAALLLISLSISNHSQAQKAGELNLDVNYQAGFPLGNYKNNMMDKSSWNGFNGDLLYSISDKWSAGLGISYQDYYQKNNRATYNLGGGTTESAVLSNSIQITPVLAKAKFFPLGGSNAVVQPYIDGGVGIGVVNFDQYTGMYNTSSRTSGRFMAAGGIGLFIPFGRLTSWGANVGANYNYINYDGRFYNQSGAIEKLNNLGHLSAYVGIHIPLH